MLYQGFAGDTPTDFDSEVGAAIPRVNLTHAGPVEAGQRGLERGDFLAVVNTGNRLGVRGTPEPRFANPVTLEGGINFLEGGQEALQ